MSTQPTPSRGALHPLTLGLSIAALVISVASAVHSYDVGQFVQSQGARPSSEQPMALQNMAEAKAAETINTAMMRSIVPLIGSDDANMAAQQMGNPQAQHELRHP